MAVGLFGLQKNTRPAPLEASTSLSMSIRRFLSRSTARTSVPIFLAVSRGFSNVGQASASGLLGDVNARTALVRISPEPGPRTIWSLATPYFVASVLTRTGSCSFALKG